LSSKKIIFLFIIIKQIL